MKDEFLWSEAYRPKLIADCILPEHLKKTFVGIVEGGEMHNMILCGTAGLGKTTVARALCEELKLDYILINASEYSGIDILRNKIRQFASTISLGGSESHKVVILDEADYLNAQSTQPALRGFMDEFSNNCRFIMTCNYKNRIIEPLQSRCSVIEFNVSKKHMPELASAFMDRLRFILNDQGVKFDESAIAELIIRFAPDWRRIIGECQRYSVSGKIDSGVLINVGDVNIQLLVKALREKDFRTMRSWVTNHIDIEPHAVFRKIFDNMVEYAKPASVPQIVLILADYSFKDSFVADHELNMVACFTELMANTEWK